MVNQLALDIAPKTLSPQQQAVLNALKHGGTWLRLPDQAPPHYWISALDLQRHSHCLCYTKRISELRRLGYTIIQADRHIASIRYSYYRLAGEPE